MIFSYSFDRTFSIRHSHLVLSCTKKVIRVHCTKGQKGPLGCDGHGGGYETRK